MTAFHHTTVDRIVTSKPCALYGVVLTADAVGTADVSLYEGQDTSSGRLIATIKTATSTTISVRWDGLALDRGLYVDVGSNVASVTVEWVPVGYPESL